jgi:hypothetical protein
MAEYKLKSKAMAAAKRVGLKGVHRMPSGKWMPGKTHAAYKKAKAKNYR